MNSRALARTAVSLAIALLAASAGAPTTSCAEEALVLSGGGARGLAHVGVVLGVERRGHDPGLVVGTSMGSIVGALYAAGYDGPAIRSIIESEDWREIFAPFPFEVGPSRALRDPVLRFDSSGRAAFGSRAYIPDWRINRRLVQLLFDGSARARGDFDSLPRRFRSMTADAATGELIPLASGDLARAVRASMAAAGFFAPVRWRDPRWGDRLLTDGGIADYLPVAEARHLGGAPIIASDVLSPPPQLPSTDAIAISRRSIEILTIHARREPVVPDILILPPLDPALAPFDYPVDPGPAMDTGIGVTVAALSDAGSTPGSRRQPLPEPASLAALEVEDAAVPEGRDTRLIPFLSHAFRPAAPSRFHADRILAIVDRLYATGLFDGVWPSVEPATGDSAGASSTGYASAPVLRVRTEARPLVSVSGALGYDNDRGGRVWASLRRLDAVGPHPLEVALEGAANGVDQWGSASARLTSLALGASAWTLGARFGETEMRFLHATGISGDADVQRAGVWAGFETRSLEPGRHAALGIRADQIESDFGPDGGSYGPWVRVEGIAPLVQVVGTPPLVEAEARAGAVDYWRAHAKGSLDRRIGPMVASLIGDGAIASRKAPLDAAPNMGEVIPGLRSGERRGRARAVAGVDVATAAAFNATLRLRARGGVIADETRAERGILYSREALWLGGVRVAALWWTPFGQVELGGEGSTLGDRRVLITLGTEF